MSILDLWWTDRGHEGGDYCRKCGLSFDGFRNEDRVCDAAKPATPQPPEWKVKEASSLSLTRVSDFIGGLLDGPPSPELLEWIDDGTHAMTVEQWRHLAEMERKARLEACGITDLMRGVSPPADRALSDFIARRKAKRAVSNTCPTTAEPWDSRPKSVVSSDELSRAMSTPLPHDPDIHTRLMPWRGK